MIRTALRRALASAAIIAALVTATACGGQAAPATPPPPAAQGTSAAPGPSAPSSAHNDSDVTFVHGMIPHHSQAVDMANLAATNTTNPKILDLAGRIEKAQAPEIETMNGFLTAWGMSPHTSSGAGGMGGIDHSSAGGMMSDPQMQQLGQAHGTEFDRMFLTMMIEHHNGAVRMAQTAVSAGQNPEVKKLAEAIIDAQRAEISEMNTLLTSA